MKFLSSGLELRSPGLEAGSRNLTLAVVPLVGTWLCGGNQKHSNELSLQLCTSTEVQFHKSISRSNAF